MSLVIQEPTIFNMSIKENISYGLENASDERIIECSKMANIHEFIESLPGKYEENVGPKGNKTLKKVYYIKI